MAVLTMKSDEYKKFPAVLKNYASHLKVITGNSEKTICEYLLDLRTFFRYYLMVQSGEDLPLEEFEKIAPVEVATEDGSKGTRGFVTDCPSLNDYKYDIWAVCGPMPMMKAVARIARSRDIECYVSLENKMACGLGACLCCVEKTVDGNQCTCTSGPVFNAATLLWD